MTRQSVVQEKMSAIKMQRLVLLLLLLLLSPLLQSHGCIFKHKHTELFFEKVQKLLINSKSNADNNNNGLHMQATNDKPKAISVCNESGLWLENKNIKTTAGKRRKVKLKTAEKATAD